MRASCNGPQTNYCIGEDVRYLIFSNMDTQPCLSYGLSGARRGVPVWRGSYRTGASSKRAIESSY